MHALVALVIAVILMFVWCKRGAQVVQTVQVVYTTKIAREPGPPPLVTAGTTNQEYQA